AMWLPATVGLQVAQGNSPRETYFLSRCRRLRKQRERANEARECLDPHLSLPKPADLALMGGGATLCSSFDLGNAAVPVEDLLAVPVQHAFMLVHVIVDLLEIFDPVRLPADVGVDRQCAEFGAGRALAIKPVELVDGAI